MLRHDQSREVCQVRVKSSSGEVTKPRKRESPKDEMPERSAGISDDLMQNASA